jgi:hypothetical protein
MEDAIQEVTDLLETGDEAHEARLWADFQTALITRAQLLEGLRGIHNMQECRRDTAKADQLRVEEQHRRDNGAMRERCEREHAAFEEQHRKDREEAARKREEEDMRGWERLMFGARARAPRARTADEKLLDANKITSKKSLRKWCLKHHPDKDCTAGATARFQAVRGAYDRVHRK